MIPYPSAQNRTLATKHMATITPSLPQKLNQPPLYPLTKTCAAATTSCTTTTTTKRTSLIFTATSALLLSISKPADAFDFRMTVPDQTVEEAESEIESHAQSLLRVKDLLTLESWREAQKLLRKSASLLRQDIYTIIQSKSPDQRPSLRRLYFDLFNGVTKLDYAARDQDRIRALEWYNGIVLSLDDILSKL